MKESWQNFKKAAAVTIGLTAGFNAKAQTNQTPESHNNTTKISKVISQEKSEMNKDTIDPFGGELVPEFDLDSIYNQNKEGNDRSFKEQAHYLDLKPNGDRIKFKFEDMLDKLYINVKNKTLVTEEVFDNLNDLNQKYPDYRVEIEKIFNEEYPKHIKNTAWLSILSEKENTLVNNFENFTPSQEDLDFIKKLVEQRNNGENIDGFDDIIRYIKNNEGIGGGPDTDHPEAIYNFYKKYSATPNALATHLTDKYFKPFVNQ